MLSLLQSGEYWDGQMAVLRNVTLQDQGVYECASLDFETGEHVMGNTTLEIHCRL